MAETRAWNDYQVGDEIYDGKYHTGTITGFFESHGFRYARVQRSPDNIPVDELNGRMDCPRPGDE